MNGKYMSSAEWRELVREPVLGRMTWVWRERPRSVLDLLELSVGHPEHIFLVKDERRITFGTFRNAIESGANELVEFGMGPDDRVLIVLYNSPEFLLAQWAAWRVGGVPVIGNRWWSEPELARAIARIDPAVIITDMPLSGVERPVLTPDCVASWWSLHKKPSIPDPRVVSDEDDVALIIFTAGSTDEPKGVQLSHRNLIWSQQTIHNLRGGRPLVQRTEPKQEVALITTPLFHNGGLMAGLMYLIDGSRMVMLRAKFDAEEVMQLIEREHCASWSAVPTMMNRVIEHPMFAKYDLTSLVAPATGGMGGVPNVLKQMKKKLPRAVLGFSTGYGMTEMSFLTIATGAQIDLKPNTVGKPIPGVELKVVDPDQSGEGELAARSGGLMVSYVGIDEQPFDEEGWYLTGDLGRIDEEGFVFLTGRSRDIVIRGGENISCLRVESALKQHEDILEVAVVGYPDKELGEGLAAIIYARPGSNVSQDTLVSFVKRELAYFEVPSRWIFRAAPLPILSSGKIDKRSLGQKVLAELLSGTE